MLQSLLLQVVHQGVTVKLSCRVFLSLVTLAVAGWQHGVLREGRGDVYVAETSTDCSRWSSYVFYLAVLKATMAT